MLAKKTYKNQVTLPKIIIKGLEGVSYFDVRREGARIVLQPVTITAAEDNLEKIRQKIQKLGITENDIQEAIRWARRKN